MRKIRLVAMAAVLLPLSLFSQVKPDYGEIYGGGSRRVAIEKSVADSLLSAFIGDTLSMIPVAALSDAERVLRADSLCALKPGFTLSPSYGDCFLFDESGVFLSRINVEESSNCAVLWQTDEPIVACFADPAEDPRHIGRNTRLYLISPLRVYASVSHCGAADPRMHGLTPECWYLLFGSGYGGALDFAANGEHGIYPNGLYLTRTWKEGDVAHNNYNFGNFLWGAATREVGVSLWIARLGAHLNNFFLSPNTKFTFDSSDDQFSISAGYHWRPY